MALEFGTLTHKELRQAAGFERGYEIFDEREFEYNGNKMGSWSLKKVLYPIIHTVEMALDHPDSY